MITTHTEKSTEIEIDELDKEHNEIIELMKLIEESSNEQIDNSMQDIWTKIVKSYTMWIITESQKKRLKEYKERKKTQPDEKWDQELLYKMKLLESHWFFEPISIYQQGKIPWRILVASVEEIMEWKEEKKKAHNGIIIEIYKSKHPKSYLYAQKNYPLAETNYI